jgi:hypothetical protein
MDFLAYCTTKKAQRHVRVREPKVRELSRFDEVIRR